MIMSSAILQPGELAPDFSLRSTGGEMVNLYQSLAHTNVVLFFYVLAFTPLCSAEVCSFRDRADYFREENAVVFGIGSEPAALAARFARHHQLPYPLLHDPGSRVRKLYRIPKVLGLLPGRVTYVIAQDRKITQALNAPSLGREHAVKILETLRNSLTKP